MTKLKLNPVNTSFFAGTFLVAAIGGGIYLWYHGLTWVAALSFLVMLTLTLMSISAGYHRLYAHRTHKTARWLEFFYLVFGAAAFQQSCGKWATEHRLHHRFVDTDDDPYNIKAGAYWAHIGWILHEDREKRVYPKDLALDPLVAWQDRNWVLLAIVAGFGLPTLVGAFFGDAWGGLIFGGFVRLVVAHHFTFMINSLAHMIGSQPYSDKNTARDSWITAIFTFGEGYHNFHHWSPGDYRNGAKFYHWDPPKWFIKTMSWFGQAWDLSRVPEEAIAKARVEMEHRKMKEKHGGVAERLDEYFTAFMKEIDELAAHRRVWMEAKRRSSAEAIKHEAELLRERFETARASYRQAYKTWRTAVRSVGQSPVIG